MPTYEYLCKSCGQRLEVQQAFTDDPLTECPTCEGPLRKVFGNVGISFKGGGFYKTDSRASSSKSDKSDSPKSEPAKSEPSKTDGGSSTSTESKAPAAASA